MTIREQLFIEFPNRDTEVLPETWEVHKPQIQNPGPFVLGKCTNLCGRHAEFSSSTGTRPWYAAQPQGTLALDGLFYTALSCTDANDLLHGGNEDLPIPNAASLGYDHNRFNDHVFQVVWDNYFYLGFGGESQRRIRHHDRVQYDRAAASEATNFTDGHTLDARGVELFLDLIELEVDNRFNFS